MKVDCGSKVHRKVPLVRRCVRLTLYPPLRRRLRENPDFPTPQTTPVGDRTHTLPQFYRDTIESTLGVWGRRLASSDRQRKDPLLWSVMEHLFQYLLFSSNRRTICSEGDSKCALLSLTRRIDEQTGQRTGPSYDTFGGMCTQLGHGSPRSRRRATITPKTKEGRTG